RGRARRGLRRRARYGRPARGRARRRSAHVRGGRSAVPGDRARGLRASDPGCRARGPAARDQGGGAPPPVARRTRVTAATTSITPTFTISATIPTLRSVTPGGHAGNALASVVPESVIHATVPSPARIPASAAHLETSGRSGSASMIAGMNWVTTL